MRILYHTFKSKNDNATVIFQHKMTTPPSFSEHNLRDLLDEIEGNIIVGIA
jgi:hypothetical protein